MLAEGRWGGGSTHLRVVHDAHRTEATFAAVDIPNRTKRPSICLFAGEAEEFVPVHVFWVAYGSGGGATTERDASTNTCTASHPYDYFGHNVGAGP